ncbi:MAG: hypothetical protein L0Z62_06890 [Gemmataceae bacterium]|nr:hypothetical protein [Gemmataceae bacterium]
MTRIVCQVITDKPGQLTFTWSDGGSGWFRPYSLAGMELDQFQVYVQEARERLADLARDWALQGNSGQDVREDCVALAQVGHRLYKAIFSPEANQETEARSVRRWLDLLQQQPDLVESMEFIVDTDCYVPWNVVYDRAPDPQAFHNDTPPERWLPFWGVRYNLASSRRVTPLRRLPLWDTPEVMLVIDPAIFGDLPAAEQQAINNFAQRRRLTRIETRNQLAAALRQFGAASTDRSSRLASGSYLIYWLSHASPDALVLSGEEITPVELKELLLGDSFDGPRRPVGLVFLNACQTARRGRAGSFLDAVFNAGLSGLIATEELTVNTFASPFGLNFLTAFLDSGEPLGQLLHKLRRGGVPMGLLYAAYCPPDIRLRLTPAAKPVEPAEGLVPPTAVPLPPVPFGSIYTRGMLLTEGGTSDQPPLPDEGPPLRPLPTQPYRSLCYFRRKDRALFAGREDDLHRFTDLLDERGTRLLVLHGPSGVGKSSFLRASVLPYLEEECIGYRALRNRNPTDNPSPAEERPVLFIRATNDLAGQLARALCSFCSLPLRYKHPDPDNQVEVVPLPDLLKELVKPPAGQLTPTPADVRAAFLNDPSLPGKLLAALGDRLPFSLLLIVDQCEEVFTLARTEEDRTNRRRALAMLRHATDTPGDFKIIVTLRTEYHGRFIDALRRQLKQLHKVREYLLTDFGEAELIDAIRRPTSREQSPYSSEIPHEKYHFEYEPGVAEQIAGEALAMSVLRRDSVLPLVQVVCTQLYELTRGQAGTVITREDLKRIGGVEGGMKRHAEGLLKRLVRHMDARARELAAAKTQRPQQAEQPAPASPSPSARLPDLHGQAASLPQAGSLAEDSPGPTASTHDPQTSCQDSYTSQVAREGESAGSGSKGLSGLLARLFGRPSEEWAFKRFFRRLYLQQPDGSLTTALSPADDLAKRWRGRLPFQEMLALAESEKFRLVRVNTLALGGGQERQYVSLGHDALAPVAAAWDEEVRRHARFRQAARRGLLVAALVLVVVVVLSLANMQAARSEATREVAQRTVESNSFAAEFVARTAGSRIRRYWRALAEVASDPQLQKPLAAAQGRSPKQHQFAEVDRWFKNRLEGRKNPEEAGWAIVNAQGYMVAHNREDKRALLGQPFGDREYFHGCVNPRDKPAKPRPLCKPHVSGVFPARDDHTPRIACSGPIWSAAEPKTSLGVMVVTVEQKEFLALFKTGQEKQRVVVFLDGQGFPVYHLRGGPERQAESRLPGVSLELLKDWVQEADQWFPRADAALPRNEGVPIPIQWRWKQLDRLGLAERPPEGIWLGAKTRVRVPAAGGGKAEETQWVVLVSEPFESITKPLEAMGDRFFLNGVIAIVIVVVVLAGVVTLLLFRVLPSGLLGDEEP